MTNRTMPERIYAFRDQKLQRWIEGEQYHREVTEYIRADVAKNPVTQLQAIWIQCKLIEMTCLADEMLSSKAKTCLENIDFEQTNVYNYYVDPRAYSENIDSINSLQAVYQDALYFTKQYVGVKKALTDLGAQQLPECQAHSSHVEYLDKFPTTRPTRG